MSSTGGPGPNHNGIPGHGGDGRLRVSERVAAGPGGTLLSSRPWDVVGSALAAPMLVWGLLNWFGSVGSDSGISGFYSGNGAAAIALVLAAGGVNLRQTLLGRPHTAGAPPVQFFLAAGAAVIALGGLLTPPSSMSIGAGLVAGFITATAQALVLLVAWMRGSGKAVDAAELQAWDAQKAAAAYAAEVSRSGQSYDPYRGTTQQPAAPYPGPQYGQPGWGTDTGPQSWQGTPQQGWPPQGWPPAGSGGQGWPQQGWPQQGQGAGQPPTQGAPPTGQWPGRGNG